MRSRAYLPPDLISNIFSRLPVESLFRFRCVCRRWRALIDAPLLREMHTHRFMLNVDNEDLHLHLDKQSDSSSVSFLILARLGKQRYHEFHFGEYFDQDEDECCCCCCCCYKVTKPIKYLRIPNFNRTQYSVGTSIVGSCNGLIPSSKTTFCVDTSVNGFGYLPTTQQYKVVRIFYDLDHYHGHFEIYTLGTRRWRVIGQIPTLFVSLVRLPGVFVNGALHWIDKDGKIALFDLATEMFRMVSSPFPPPLTLLVPENTHYYELGVMGGRSLCVIKHNIHKSVDIWVMDNSTIEEEEEEESWTIKFSIPIREAAGWCHPKFDYDWEEFDDYNFVTITKSGKVLLWYNGTGLVSYDPKTEEFTLHGDYKADPSWFEAVIYRKSFVSLKALGEDSQIMA